MPNPGSPEQFAIDVSRWSAKAKANARAVAVETIQDIAYEIVTTTPVDTGFLRGSWFASIGTPPSGTGGTSRDALGSIGLEVSILQLGQVFYMGNTAKYALRLEYGFTGADSLGRNYNQRGRYWVTSVLNQAQAIANAAAARVAARAA